jgi:hypothetical protein
LLTQCASVLLDVLQRHTFEYRSLRVGVKSVEMPILSMVGLGSERLLNG